MFDVCVCTVCCGCVLVLLLFDVWGGVQDLKFVLWICGDGGILGPPNKHVMELKEKRTSLNIGFRVVFGYNCN